MSIHLETKLKHLLRMWPMHTAIPVLYLKKQGYSGSLIQRYISSGWMAPLTRGVMVRLTDRVDWMGVVWGVQQVSDVHVGGRTALELLGKAHYIRTSPSEVYLFTASGITLPKWLLKNDITSNLIYIKTNLLPKNIAFIEHSQGEFSLRISNPARAIVEYLYMACKNNVYDEAYYLMENLNFTAPSPFQEVLETCTSIKIKRMLLCLAKKTGAAWLKQLDMSRINLGAGPREIISGGRYDPDYQITYPKEWDKNEDKLAF